MDGTRSSKRKRDAASEAESSKTAEARSAAAVDGAAGEKPEEGAEITSVQANPSGEPFTELEVKWTWTRYHLRDRAYKIMINGYETIGGYLRKVLGKMSLAASERVHKSVLGCYVRLEDFTTKCGQMIQYVAFRQVTPTPDFDPTSLFFRINNKVIRFSRVEFALVSGLRFGPANFNPYKRQEIPPNSVFEKLFGARPETTAANVRNAYVAQKFKIGKKVVEADDEDNVKLSKLLIAVSCVLGLDNSKKKIPLWVWGLIEDEKEWEEFPWGSISYQMTHDCIMNIATMDRKSAKINVHIKGNSITLLAWIYEAIGAFGTIVGMMKEDKQKPRFLRYSYVKERSYPTEMQINEVLVQKLKPSKKEIAKPYWKSLELDPEGQELAFKYDAFDSKKKKRKEDDDDDDVQLLSSQVDNTSSSSSYVTMAELEKVLDKYVSKIGDYVVQELLEKACLEENDPMKMYCNHEEDWGPVDQDDREQLQLVRNQ